MSEELIKELNDDSLISYRYIRVSDKVVTSVVELENKTILCTKPISRKIGLVALFNINGKLQGSWSATNPNEVFERTKGLEVAKHRAESLVKDNPNRQVYDCDWESLPNHNYSKFGVNNPDDVANLFKGTLIDLFKDYYLYN